MATSKPMINARMIEIARRNFSKIEFSSRFSITFRHKRTDEMTIRCLLCLRK